eukprot:4646127-Amphidinium_carterae.1
MVMLHETGTTAMIWGKLSFVEDGTSRIARIASDSIHDTRCFFKLPAHLVARFIFFIRSA